MSIPGFQCHTFMIMPVDFYEISATGIGKQRQRAEFSLSQFCCSVQCLKA